MKKVILFLSLLIIAFPFQILAQNTLEGVQQNPSAHEKKTFNKYLTLTLNGKEGGHVDSSEIAKWFTMVVEDDSSTSFLPDSMKYHVNSFQCIIQHKSGAYAFSFNGANVSSDFVDMATQCRKGELIIFYNVKISSKFLKAKSIDSGPVFRVL